MISVDNRNYCKHCFAELSFCEDGGHVCTSHSNYEDYPCALQEGQVLAGKYIVGKVLGKGGFGITYLCFDTFLKRRVAIKEYFPDTYSHRDSGKKTVSVTNSETMYKYGADKFYNEAKLLAQFKNTKGIVEVYEFFRENNTVYFVMEMLDGCDLRTLCKSNRICDENYVVYLVLETLKSLKILHEHNVIHRDISPDNIYLCNDGNIKLIDFGAARVTAGDSSKKLSVLLKKEFAPLEQYQSNGKQGPWTDIYALGATMYYLLKRIAPEDAVSRLNCDSLNMSGITPEIAAVLNKMLALQIDSRYKNVQEVIDDLMKTQRYSSVTENVLNDADKPSNEGAFSNSRNADKNSEILTEQSEKTSENGSFEQKNHCDSLTFEKETQKKKNSVWSAISENSLIKWLFISGCICAAVILWVLIIFMCNGLL